jgi:hypothetical protein
VLAENGITLISNGPLKKYPGSLEDLEAEQVA